MNIEDIKKEYENRFVVIHIGDKQISGVFSGYASGDPILEHFGRDAQNIIWNFFESKLNQTAEEAVGKFYQEIDNLLEIEGEDRMRDFIFEIWEKKTYLSQLKKGKDE